MHLNHRRLCTAALLALAGTFGWADAAPDGLLFNGSAKPWTLKLMGKVGSSIQAGSLKVGESGAAPKVLINTGDSFQIQAKKLYTLTYLDDLGHRVPHHRDFLLVDSRGASVQMEALRTVAVGSNVWVHTLTEVPMAKWQDFEHQFSLNHLAPGSIAIRCDAVPDYLVAPK